MRMILASESPRRQQLMRLITPEFTVHVAHVPEEERPDELPEHMVVRLAMEKAGAVFSVHPQSVVIGCDTVVDLDGKALGKPTDQKHAMHMLRALSGRSHKVHTGVCIYTPEDAEEPAALFAETSTVWFAPLSEEELFEYTNTPEPYDKAGGYGIQGAASRFIPKIEGCYYNIMGLPVAALYGQLKYLRLLHEDR